MEQIQRLTTYLYIPPPKNGYLDAIAKELGMHKTTVARALNMETSSPGAEKVRYLYYQWYVKPYIVRWKKQRQQTEI
ncbi:MAG: hypothetical protein IJ169_04480 [Paludibacteraceae bacterium]|nr:hypothetical protein [Paludibacteraceae bacterium]